MGPTAWQYGKPPHVVVDAISNVGEGGEENLKGWKATDIDLLSFEQLRNLLTSATENRVRVGVGQGATKEQTAHLLP